MSGYRLELGTEQLKRLAELLMGAAHADGDYDGDEAEAIGDILHELMEGVPVPNAVTAHLARFDVDTLDIPAACALLRSSERPARRAILALISHVLDADGMLTDEESDYIKRIGQAIGAHIDEYRDLTLDLTIMIDAVKV
jgi:uncharacterized tellurite resistance protein B-like protein